MTGDGTQRYLYQWTVRGFNHQAQLFSMPLILPASDYERLASHLELIPMSLGDVLYESGGELRYVYFPTTSIVSLLYIMEDGASAEIAIVGNEGILGIALFMGGNTTPSPRGRAECGTRFSPQGRFAQD